MKSFTISAILVGLTAASAWAGDVPVQYDADLKAFKKGVDAETVLRFELFDDASCNNEIDQMDFDGSEVTVEQVKPLKVKGGDKPSQRARISAVIEDAVESDGYFLTVRVPGENDVIVPVGPECQAQAAGTAGPQGPEGPAGTFSAGFCQRIAGNSISFNPLSGGVEDQTSTATCDPGDVVVGGGQGVNQASSDQTCVVLENAPNSGLTAWTLRIVSPTQSQTCAGSFFAVAICCGT